MKRNACALVLLALMASAITQANPCWSYSDSCAGNACGPNPQGTPTQCDHIYCDDAAVCKWNSDYTEMLDSSRTMYTQTMGKIQTTCVTSPTISAWLDGNGHVICCQCSSNGTLQYQ